MLRCTCLGFGVFHLSAVSAEQKKYPYEGVIEPNAVLYNLTMKLLSVFLKI